MKGKNKMYTKLARLLEQEEVVKQKYDISKCIKQVEEGEK